MEKFLKMEKFLNRKNYILNHYFLIKISFKKIKNIKEIKLKIFYFIFQIFIQCLF